MKGDPLEELVGWIHVSDLENADVLKARDFVRRSLEKLPDTDVRRDALKAIESTLWEGVIPVDELRQFALESERLHPEEREPSDVERLEGEFRAVAAGLDDEDWATPGYLEIERAVQAFEEGGAPEELMAALETMRARLDAAWLDYSRTPVEEHEVAAESVVGHRLLQEGFELWFQSLEELEQALAQGSTFDPGLQTAENANRLLVTIERLRDRVQQAGGGPEC